LKRLTNGWQLNSAFSFHAGPALYRSGKRQYQRNGENADRANLWAIPMRVSPQIVGGVVTWFSPTGLWIRRLASTARRDASVLQSGYSDVDLSVFKTPPF